MTQIHLVLLLFLVLVIVIEPPHTADFEDDERGTKDENSNRLGPGFVFRMQHYALASKAPYRAIPPLHSPRE